MFLRFRLQEYWQTSPKREERRRKSSREPRPFLLLWNLVPSAEDLGGAEGELRLGLRTVVEAGGALHAHHVASPGELDQKPGEPVEACHVPAADGLHIDYLILGEF